MAKLIVANWKMNPRTVDEEVALAKAADVKELAVAPPFPFLASVSAVLRRASLAAQDLSSEDEGAFTGEVSASQLREFGVTYVIVGHSERRHHLAETDEVIARKVATALKHRLTPILCVGETREERASGGKEAVIERQLKIGLSIAGSVAKVIIAYEPLWAISASPGAHADTVHDTAGMVQYIRSVLAAIGKGEAEAIIYGGSVTSKNIEEFLSYQDIGGALVGGASLKKEEIKKIVKAAATYE